MTREEAIIDLNALKFILDNDQYTDEIEEALDTAISALQQPERKGRWIPVTNGRGGHECDQCHNYAPAWQTGEERLTAYCPNCGCKMEVEG